MTRLFMMAPGVSGRPKATIQSRQAHEGRNQDHPHALRPRPGGNRKSTGRARVDCSAADPRNSVRRRQSLWPHGPDSSTGAGSRTVHPRKRAALPAYSERLAIDRACARRSVGVGGSFVGLRQHLRTIATLLHTPPHSDGNRSDAFQSAAGQRCCVTHQGQHQSNLA